MKYLKYTLWVVAGLLLAGVATVLIINATLPGREKKLNDDWGKTLISLDELAKQYPKVEDNASALAVEKLAAPLGICMAPGGGECKRAKPADEDVKAFDAVLDPRDKSKSLGDYLNDQLEKTGGDLDPPPERLKKFLTDRAAALAALRDQINHDDPPRWSQDPGKGISMELPNLRGLMSLSRLLAADALAALQEGREAPALDDLNAAWRLHEQIADSPALASRITGLKMERIALGVVRAFAAPPAGWQDRLKGMDPRKSISLGIATEALMMQRLIATLDAQGVKEVTSMEGRASFAKRAPEFVQRPYLRLSVAESSEAMRLSLEKYRQMDPCEIAAHQPSEAETMAGLSWWNVLGKIAVIDSKMIWTNAARHVLELEMTRKLLEVKRARAAANGVWPVNPEAIGESSCKAGKWDYQVAADGSMTLAFSPKIEWDKNVKHPNIPLSVTVKAPAHP